MITGGGSSGLTTAVTDPLLAGSGLLPVENSWIEWCLLVATEEEEGLKSEVSFELIDVAATAAEDAPTDGAPEDGTAIDCCEDDVTEAAGVAELPLVQAMLKLPPPPEVGSKC